MPRTSAACIRDRVNEMFGEKWALKLEDIDSHWMDVMVKRMIAELHRQLLHIENDKREGLNAGERLANARTLTALHKSLKEMGKLERERETMRESKMMEGHEDVIAALKRRLDRQRERRHLLPLLSGPQQKRSECPDK